MWVKDSSINHQVEPQSILLYTCGDTCKDFFGGIQPCNLYLDSNKKYTYQIERLIRRMCRFNVFIEAMVEKMPDNQLRLVDCRLHGNEQR